MMTNQIDFTSELFQQVQLQNILGDGKTFPDCIPNRAVEIINQDYLKEKDKANFNLAEFVSKNFTLPTAYSAGYTSDAGKTPQQHIEALWDVLTRKPDNEAGSLIPLPHPYLVPGGRFREIYYWDSYFTMLGLKVSGRKDLIQHMVDNFAFLINQVGYIPNGNRSYFIGRSQPPFFSLMVKLLSELRKNTLTKYLPHLEKEYVFWMNGQDTLSEKNPARHRVVRLPDGTILNRYWDEHDTPRPESYKEDVELSHQSTQHPPVLFRHLRAAAESGWDFSCRWFKDEKSFATIHTTEILPVDLNCLLLHLELLLAECFRESGNTKRSSDYQQLAAKRKAAIKTIFWNEPSGFFFDYDFVSGKQKESLTLAAAFPLFFEVASPSQALAVEEKLKEKFLKPGGLTTTLVHSGQQWDAPNGWAPLQWIAYRGLLNYGLDETASLVKTNWTTANQKVYAQTGKMTEKYDVWNKSAEASGGEYPNQDGFGWTNGVFLAMTS